MAQRRTVLLTVVLALVATVLGVATPAVATPSTAAAPSWTISTPPVPQTPTGTFAAVSCPADGPCLAVGRRGGDGGGVVPFAAQRGSSTGWQPATAPFGAVTSGAVDDVDCPTAAFCVAVGERGDGLPALAVRRSGVWSNVTPPAIPGVTSLGVLPSVSCVSATWCVAVGFAATTAGGRLAAFHWDGSTWTGTRLDVPVATFFGNGLAVDCASRTRCLLVVEQDAVAVAWDGTSWTNVPYTPRAGSGERFNDVACTTASCTVVGETAPWPTDDGLPNPPAPLVEVLRDGAWSAQPLPGATTGSATGITCTSSTSCVVVGGAVSSSYTWFDDSAKPFAYARATAGWNAKPAVVPPGSLEGAGLTSVSCTGPKQCVAVGVGPGNGPLAERYNGTWTLEDAVTRTVDAYVDLSGVACPAVSDCTVVGDYRTLGQNRALVERRVGTTWSVAPLPDLGDTRLFDVECVATTSCLAVGQQSRVVGSTQALVLRFDGSSWSAVPLPAIGGRFVSLADVSCAKKTMCVAVGSADASGVSLRWNGTSWSRVTVPPTPSGNPVTLEAVDCPAVSSCQASGSSSQAGAVTKVAYGFDGTAWTRHAAGAPYGAIDCRSATACQAVGTDRDDFRPTAASWDGSAWTTVRAAPPATEGQLFGLSCTATLCVAVGGTTSNRPYITSRTGTGPWTAEPVAGPPGMQFDAVSCPNERCVAVGENFVTGLPQVAVRG